MLDGYFHRKTNLRSQDQPNDNNIYSSTVGIRAIMLQCDILTRLLFFDQTHDQYIYNLITCHKNYDPAGSSRSDFTDLQTRWKSFSDKNAFFLSHPLSPTLDFTSRFLLPLSLTLFLNHSKPKNISLSIKRVARPEYEYNIILTRKAK